VPDLRAAYDARDKDAMVALVDDELCDAIAVAGPADEVRERVGAWDDVADRLLMGGPWYGPSFERMLENGQAILETFGSSS
jgi:hypothetical protein